MPILTNHMRHRENITVTFTRIGINRRYFSKQNVMIANFLFASPDVGNTGLVEAAPPYGAFQSSLPHRPQQQ